MTIKEHLTRIEAVQHQPAAPGVPSLKEAMMEATEIWSNNAARGYFIHAAKLAGLDQDTTRKVLTAFSEAFEEMSVDEAEREYINY